jgi:hypothetical protein
MDRTEEDRRGEKKKGQERTIEESGRNVRRTEEKKGQERTGEENRSQDRRGEDS